ncbi:MAG: hypothetical protein H7831_03950 [Magnetococcus sp. WYHC-3]
MAFRSSTLLLSLLMAWPATGLARTVAEMLSAAATTQASIESSVAGGGTFVINATQLEDLIIGKLDQQLTTRPITDYVSAFNVTIGTSQVTATMDVQMVDVIYDRLPSSVQTQADSLFGNLSVYDSNDTVRLNFVVVPVVSGDNITFNTTSSYVTVTHQSGYYPSASFTLSTLITTYNSVLTVMSSDGLKFFTGDSDDNDSQEIPTTQSFDYYFSGMSFGSFLSNGTIQVSGN